MIKSEDLEVNKLYQDEAEGSKKTFILITDIKDEDDISFIRFLRSYNWIMENAGYQEFEFSGIAEFDPGYRQLVIERCFNRYKKMW